MIRSPIVSRHFVGFEVECSECGTIDFCAYAHDADTLVKRHKREHEAKNFSNANKEHGVAMEKL